MQEAVFARRSARRDFGLHTLAPAGGARPVRDGEPRPSQPEAAPFGMGAHGPGLPLRRPCQRGGVLDRLASPGAARQRGANRTCGSDRANAPARSETRGAAGFAGRCSRRRRVSRRGGESSRSHRRSGGSRGGRIEQRGSLDLLRRRHGHHHGHANRERAEDARHVSHDDSDEPARSRLHRKPVDVRRPPADAAARGRRHAR
jgi:hypothetical protein